MKSRIILANFLVLSFTALLFQSCKEETESVKPVDLRYHVPQDEYILKADGSEKVNFLVKSTEPWTVFGNEEKGWYTITPNQGDDTEKTYDVTITCKENTDLDDRSDIINIKSDYWLGKQFRITQKGIAYLRTSDTELIPQAGGKASIKVESNQKWTAKVTKGESWLDIQSGESGEQNQSIELNLSINKGEQRKGEVSIFDRHGELAATAICTQDGVLLLPNEPDNGKWYKVYEKAQNLTIHVESNTRWTIEKENPEEEDWFEFEQTEFDGNGDIVVRLNANNSSVVRAANIILKTVAEEEDVTPVVKSIRFKQANPPQVKTYEINRNMLDDTYYGPDDNGIGQYNIYISSMDAATELNTFIIFSPKNVPYLELRYHVYGQKTELSTTPYCEDVNAYVGSCIQPVDGTKENKFTFFLDKRVDKKGNEWMYTEWRLNDVVIGKATSDGIVDYSGASDSWKVPFEEYQKPYVLVRAKKGNAQFSKWEYIPPINWGE